MQNTKYCAPGRLCLFGEHQDYLGLPTIAVAIDKHIYLECVPKTNSEIKIFRPDITSASLKIPLSEERCAYQGERGDDYLKACYNVLLRAGCRWDHGFECKITGTIPINAGASSSSALVIGSLLAFSDQAGRAFNPSDLALMGYQAEVEEFNEAGGMMDHYASAVGGVTVMQTKPPKLLHHFDSIPGVLVMANSRVKKTTVDDLRRVKTNALASIDAIKKFVPYFEISRSLVQDIHPFLSKIPEHLQKILLGNMRNRDLTEKALALLLKQDGFDLSQFGRLLKEHHRHLSENVGVSIPKIDQMVECAIDNGALGAKINGSGFGGTMFALCADENTAKQVKDALIDLKTDAWLVNIANGASKMI